MQKQVISLTKPQQRSSETISKVLFYKAEDVKALALVSAVAAQSSWLATPSTIHTQAVYLYKVVFPFFQLLLTKNIRPLFKSMISFSLLKKHKAIKVRESMKIGRGGKRFYIRKTDSKVATFFWKATCVQQVPQHNHSTNASNRLIKPAVLVQKYSRHLSATQQRIRSQVTSRHDGLSTVFFSRKIKLKSSKLVNLQPLRRHTKNVKKQLVKLSAYKRSGCIYRKAVSRSARLNGSDQIKLSWLSSRKKKRDIATKRWSQLYRCRKLTQSQLRKYSPNSLSTFKRKNKYRRGRSLLRPRAPVFSYVRGKLFEYFRAVRNRYYSRLARWGRVGINTLSMLRTYGVEGLAILGSMGGSRWGAVRPGCVFKTAPLALIRAAGNRNRRGFGVLREKREVSSWYTVGSTGTKPIKYEKLFDFKLFGKQRKNLTTRLRRFFTRQSTRMSVKRRGWLASKRSAGYINGIVNKQHRSVSEQVSIMWPVYMRSRQRYLLKNRIRKLLRKASKRFHRRRPYLLSQKNKSNHKLTRGVRSLLAKKQKSTALKQLRKKYKFFFSKFKNWRRCRIKFFNRRAVKLGRKKWEKYVPVFSEWPRGKPLINRHNLKKSLIRLVRRGFGSSLLSVQPPRTAHTKPLIKNFIKYYLYKTRFKTKTTLPEDIQLCAKRRGKRFNNIIKYKAASTTSNAGLLLTRLKVSKDLIKPLNSNIKNGSTLTVPSRRNLDSYRALYFRHARGRLALVMSSKKANQSINYKNFLRLRKSNISYVLQAYPWAVSDVRRVRKASKRKQIAPFVCRKLRERSAGNFTSFTVQSSNNTKYLPIFNKQSVGKKNIKNQYKSNKVYRSRKYAQLNNLAIVGQFIVKKQKEFEEFREWRIHRRCWPQEPIFKNRKLAFLKKKKDNYLLRLRQIYTVFFNKNKGNSLSPSLRRVKPLSSLLAKTRVSTGSIKKFGSRSIAIDLSRKFIEILWRAQEYHKTTHQKQVLANRWKFKKKFWLWHKYASKFKSLQFRHGISELPSLFLYLVKIKLFSSFSEVFRVARYNTITVNGAFVSSEYERLSVGDIVQLCPNLKTVIKASVFRKNVLARRMKKIKKTQRIVIQSQWRDRKKQTPDYFTTSTYLQFFAVPVWTQFDFFTSSMAVIRQPTQVQSTYQASSPRYMLDKLTPWRLKI